MTHRTLTLTLVLGAIVSLLALPASAARETQKVRGEVVAMGDAAPGPDGTSVRQIQLRTRDGEQVMLQLRERDTCPDCLRVGDQIRARIHTQDQEGAAMRIQSMRVNREGQRIHYQQGSGGWQRGPQGEPGAGAGTRQRDRVHTPDASGGAGPQGEGPPQGRGSKGSSGSGRGRG